MKKLIAMLIMLLPFGAMAAGQSHGAGNPSSLPENMSLGIRLGFNALYVDSDEGWRVFTNKYGLGGNLSLEVAYGFTPNLYLHSGLGVEHRHFQNNSEEQCNCATPIDEEGNVVTPYTYEYNNRYQYIGLEIPMLLQYQVPKVLFFEAGLLIDASLFSWYSPYVFY